MPETPVRLTEVARRAVAAVLHPGDWAIDATLGNGHDCRFLAARVGARGRVFGFDIQAAALQATRRRLADEGLDDWAVLFQAGHEQMVRHLPGQAGGRIAAVMFNLGYLPGRDKAIVTRSATTLAAVEQALGLLRAGGLVSLLVYVGHPGGAAELQALLSRLPDWRARGCDAEIRRGAAANSPVLLLLRRRETTGQP